MTLPDQVLANALAYLTARIVSDPAREDLMIAEIRDMLPRVSGHRAVRPLAAAARTYLATIDEEPHNLRRRSLAQVHIAGPVADFLFSRAALAREALVLADAHPQPHGGPDEGRCAV
jgi:hypothetical protein